MIFKLLVALLRVGAEIVVLIVVRAWHIRYYLWYCVWWHVLRYVFALLYHRKYLAQISCTYFKQFFVRLFWCQVGWCWVCTNVTESNSRMILWARCCNFWSFWSFSSSVWDAAIYTEEQKSEIASTMNGKNYWMSHQSAEIVWILPNEW